MYHMRKTGKLRARIRRHTRRKMRGGRTTLYSYKDDVGEVPFYVNDVDPVFGFGIKQIQSIFRLYKHDKSKGEFDPYDILPKKFNGRWSVGVSAPPPPQNGVV